MKITLPYISLSRYPGKVGLKLPNGFSRNIVKVLLLTRVEEEPLRPWLDGGGKYDKCVEYFPTGGHK